MLLEEKNRELERVNRIWNHPEYRRCLSSIKKLERDRVFCGHDEKHFLDVARLAYIDSLEKGLDIPKDMIYAASLLHDIGRHLQYEKNIPHHRGSQIVAEPVLRECGYTDEEIREILEAIGSHRESGTKNRDDLAGILYRADKLSRCCFSCEAEKECNWSMEKKNLKIGG